VRTPREKLFEGTRMLPEGRVRALLDQVLEKE
jgi:hypothetical protein